MRRERGLHTVCAWCERVRNAIGEWRADEETKASSSSTTHGICPDCLERATARAVAAPRMAG